MNEHEDDGAHGHGHADGEGHGHEHGGIPHEPAPPEPRRIIPEGPLLIRGLAFAGFAVGAGWLALNAVRSSWLLAPVSLALGIAGGLSAWAAAIHLTGGERFDDHPFV